jgi:hypothetical protein
MSGRGNEASPGRKWAPTMAIDGGMSGERKRRGPGGRGSCGVAMAGGGGGGATAEDCTMTTVVQSLRVFPDLGSKRDLTYGPHMS